MFSKSLPTTMGKFDDEKHLFRVVSGCLAALKRRKAVKGIKTIAINLESLKFSRGKHKAFSLRNIHQASVALIRKRGNLLKHLQASYN